MTYDTYGMQFRKLPSIDKLPEGVAVRLVMRPVFGKSASVTGIVIDNEHEEIITLREAGRTQHIKKRMVQALDRIL